MLLPKDGAATVVVGFPNIDEDPKEFTVVVFEANAFAAEPKTELVVVLTAPKPPVVVVAATLLFGLNGEEVVLLLTCPKIDGFEVELKAEL